MQDQAKDYHLAINQEANIQDNQEVNLLGQQVEKT